jgi:hypothetical protein
MDNETIQKIAAEVVRHLPSYAWVLLLTQVALTLVAAGVGAFLGEYLRTRGKNLATKADFDSLKAQLSANTKLVETIKAEVGQRDWAKREWTNLRRTKLEALLSSMHDCESYLDRLRTKAISGEGLTPERDPMDELNAIAALYLPELRGAVVNYSVACRKLLSIGLHLRQEVLHAGTDIAARQKAYDKHSANWSLKEVLDTREALKTAARALLVEIMGVNSGND